MRYLIHLLPDEPQRRALDDLRARLAAVIGPNRALDYPTAHVTLVWAIQEGPGDAAPVDAAALIGLLETCRGGGPLTLAARRDSPTREHLLLPLNDTPQLAALRHRLLEGARAIAAGPDGADRPRAERVREQPWPHLTLAQEIDPDRWARGAAFLAEESLWRTNTIRGTALALLARDTARGEPYRIVHQATLTNPDPLPGAPGRD